MLGSDSSGNLRNRVDRILKESLGSSRGSCTPAKCSGIVFFSSLDFDPVLHDPGIIFFSKPVKIIERIIYYKLTSALEKSGCLCDNQFGFNNKRSTVSLLLSAVHDWCKCLQDRSSFHYLFLNFAKVFDSVPHERLLLKLEALGISRMLLKWICSFLTFCFQRVTINVSHSS